MIYESECKSNTYVVDCDDCNFFKEFKNVSNKKELIALLRKQNWYFVDYGIRGQVCSCPKCTSVRYVGEEPKMEVCDIKEIEKPQKP